MVLFLRALPGKGLIQVHNMYLTHPESLFWSRLWKTIIIKMQTLRTSGIGVNDLNQNTQPLFVRLHCAIQKRHPKAFLTAKGR